MLFVTVSPHVIAPTTPGTVGVDEGAIEGIDEMGCVVGAYDSVGN